MWSDERASQKSSMSSLAADYYQQRQEWSVGAEAHYQPLGDKYLLPFGDCRVGEAGWCKHGPENTYSSEYSDHWALFNGINSGLQEIT